jgi:hypothetical protein
MQIGLPQRGASALIQNTMVANAPQLALSLLYYQFNGILTSMCLASEWSNFGQTRKGLRVSDKPQKAQRSTYFLQPPYIFALPLILVFGPLHWLVSQSFSLISVKVYDASGNHTSPASPYYDESEDFITCAYSLVPIIIVVALALMLLLVVIGLGFRQFSTAMPVAGSCSAAIV